MKTIESQPLRDQTEWWVPKNYPSSLVRFGYFSKGDFFHPTPTHPNLYTIGVKLIYPSHKLEILLDGSYVYKLIPYNNLYKWVSIPTQGIMFKGKPEQFVKHWNDMIDNLVSWLKNLIKDSPIVEIWHVEDYEQLSFYKTLYDHVECRSQIVAYTLH